MPNHITSIVRIKDERDLEDYDKQEAGFKKFADKFRTKESDFDFNAVVPMPANIFRGDLGEKERKEHGANNWYDWAVANWGTKWNSYDVVYIEEAKYIEMLVKFETAWAPPIPVLEAIADLGYRVDYSWVDEGDDEWRGWETIPGKH